MKILLFHQYFLTANEPGGSRWGQLTQFWTEDKNIQVQVVSGTIHYATGKSITGGKAFAREKISNRLSVFRTWTYSGYNANFLGRLIGYLSFMTSSVLRALFLPRPDVVVCTSPPLFIGVSCLVYCFLRRVPFVFEVRDLWPDSAIAAGVVSNRHLLAILYWLEKVLYHKAAHIVVLTPAFRDDIIRRFPQTKTKISVITNSPDFDLIPARLDGPAIRGKHGWDGKKVYGYFGAHGVANDLDQIVDIALKLKDRRDLHFVLVGDGMKKDTLKKRVASLSLTNVEFIDSVAKDDVFHYIDACDVCMATLKKSDVFKTVYPNKVFDYMACKKPSLVTIDGITRELVEGPGAGFYSEPENERSLQTVVEKMAGMSPQELKQMGDRGFEFATANFNRKTLAEKYLQILDTI